MSSLNPYATEFTPMSGVADTIFSPLETPNTEVLAYPFSYISNSSGPIASDRVQPVAITESHVKAATQCHVCLEAFKEGEKDTVKLTACEHIFHRVSCLAPWLATNTTCPVCRCDLEVEGDKYSSDNDTYKVEARGAPHEEPINMEEFPHNITEYYWIHEGENDEEAWHVICKTSNDAYVYYTASCDYTGFDCQGSMAMWASRDKQTLISLIDKGTLAMCLKEKRAGVQEKRKTWEERLRETNDQCAPRMPPPEQSGRNAVNPTRAFIRVWNNDVEVPVNLNNMTYAQVSNLESAVRGLTSTYISPPSAPGTLTIRNNKKKYYNVNMQGATIRDIDKAFIKRFGNPDKKWTLREPRGAILYNWYDGKVEVTFTLF